LMMIFFFQYINLVTKYRRAVRILFFNIIFNKTH
jgi:hypothetical protein